MLSVEIFKLMKTKNKIILIIIVIISFSFLIISVDTIYNFKKYEVKTIKDKAQVIAKIVEQALTFQMVHKVVSQRDFFLNQLEEIPNIDKIWLSRGHKVMELYGKGLNIEKARDEIDKEVLNTGIEKQFVENNLFSKSTFRITIPYKATSKGETDCISCHTNAKEGDTLGAVSIQITTDETKELGFNMITSMILIAFVFIVIVSFLLNFTISPFLLIFDSIKKVMGKAQEGDYSYRVDNIQNKEAKEVSSHVNNLLEKLELTLDDIDSNISSSLSDNQIAKDKDQLINVKHTVKRLADVYKFKKSIEYEKTLKDIYERLAEVLERKLEFHDFIFFEENKKDKKTKNIYFLGEIASNIIKNIYKDDSITLKEFENSFSSYIKKDDINYFLIIYPISDEINLIMYIYTKSEIKNLIIKEATSYLQDYIDEAKAVIMNKKFMDILEKNAQTDPLTGLYNRQYLINSMSQTVSQVQRLNISMGVLLLDIDHFKMVNDTYGHDIGDKAIKTVVQILNENIRESDIPIRFGGEEFLILLYNCDEKSIVKIADKIRINFSKKDIPINKDKVINKTVSIGAAMYPNDSKDLNKCIKYADIALYAAKNTGRNKVIRFEPKLLEI